MSKWRNLDPWQNLALRYPVFPFSPIFQVLSFGSEPCFGKMTKQKEPITQNIRNRREHGSRFKVMFYVIGSENQSRVLLHTAPANRTNGVVEQFGASGVPIPCRITPTSFQCDRTFYSVVYVVAKPPFHYYTKIDPACQCRKCKFRKNRKA